jgi:LacI family transcriptional regulator
VGGPADIPQVRDRLTGAQAAVSAVAGADLIVFPTSATTVLEGRRAGQEICSWPVSGRPDALFAANDLVALGLLQAFGAEGSIRVPEDLAIVGYDDIDFAASASVPLTSIAQPSALMGKTALKLLSEEVADPDKIASTIIFQPELVIRSSA